MMMGHLPTSVTGVGPPTFSWTADDGAWSGTSTQTSGTDAIGAASATRRVVVMGRIANGNGNVLLSAGSTIGGVAVDYVSSDLASDAANIWFVASAIVPTGTTAAAALAWTTPGGNPSATFASFFIVDNSQLASSTPTIAIGTAAAATSLTKTIAVSAGSSILAVCMGSGTSTVPQITSSTATFTNDGTISSFYSSGHANSAAANGASSVTETWTGSANVGLLLVAYR